MVESCFICPIPYISAVYCNMSQFYDCQHTKRSYSLLTTLLKNSRIFWASLHHCQRKCLPFVCVCVEKNEEFSSKPLLGDF